MPQTYAPPARSAAAVRAVAVSPAPEAEAPPRPAARIPAFVDALRGNPDAARQALVYAEIFGPPLADRH